MDVAILISDLWRERPVKHTNDEDLDSVSVTHIKIPEMWGEWIEQSLVLTRGFFCGYPVVPRSDGAYKLAASAEIHTEINRYDTSNVHFIVSSTARGGFSGAAFISEFDILLGIVTEALYDEGSHPYMAVIAIESIYPIFEREDVLRGRLEHYLSSWSELALALEERPDSNKTAGRGKRPPASFANSDPPMAFRTVVSDLEHPHQDCKWT